MRPSTISRYSLPVIAIVLLTAAITVWSVRRARKERIREERAQQVVQLLKLTRNADTTLKYSAIATVTALYGHDKMVSTAELVRAPRMLSIHYLTGDLKGRQSGYNERWFWRQDNSSSPLEAYAEVAYRPDEMTQRRFDLMMKNYRGEMVGKDSVDQRPAKVVEVRPLQPVDGAQGPYKRLWIDSQSGITLRMDSFNYRGEPVMQTVLSEVNLQPQITAATFVPPAKMSAAAVTKPWVAEELGQQKEKVAKMTGMYPPQPEYRPNGFVLDAVGVHRLGKLRVPVMAALSRYTDGINVLTIFAIKPEGLSQAGSDAVAKPCGYGPATMTMRTLPEGHLIAVADLPPQTLRRVLESTRIRMVAVQPSR